MISSYSIQHLPSKFHDGLAHKMRHSMIRELPFNLFEIATEYERGLKVTQDNLLLF